MLAIGLLRESPIKSQEKSKKTIFYGILSRDKSMKKLFDNIRKVAKTDASIHISSEFILLGGMMQESPIKHTEGCQS
jgi:hypothetical protein